MAESMVDSLNTTKIGEPSPSINPGLEVSVSFGKFENDLLSWEKWSCFSPNKYLEEVEKCKTPGSVAQKKAYFEAHYKTIAAKKAELIDQDKQMCSSPLSSNGENNGSIDTELNISEVGISSHVVKLDDESSEERIDEINEGDVVKQETKLDAINDKGMTVAECQSLLVEGAKEKRNDNVDGSNSMEAEIFEEEKEKNDSSVVSRELNKMQHNSGKEGVKLKEESIKSYRSNEPHKATPVSEEKNTARIKKKQVSPSPMPKPQFSTPSATKTQFSSPRVSKPAPTSLTMSMSRSSMVNANSSSLLRSKNYPGESKTVASKSLNMSFLDSPIPDPPSLMKTRKSLIMEQMGDKEIVKRAFKSFQNNYNNQSKSSNEIQSAIPNQVPAKATQERVNSLVTPRKENGGILKAVVMDKKNAKTAPSSSFGLMNDGRTEKSREFSKMLLDKSNAREAGKTQHQTKSKEIMREADVKHMVHWGLRVSKKPSDKGVSKNEQHPLTGPTGLKRNQLVTRIVH